MTITEVKKRLNKIKLPADCTCGDSVCTKTHDVRFERLDRDAIKVAIDYYLQETFDA